MHSDMCREPEPDDEKKKAELPQTESYLHGKKPGLYFRQFALSQFGAGKFEEVSDRMGAENYWPWGPASAI